MRFTQLFSNSRRQVQPTEPPTQVESEPSSAALALNELIQSLEPRARSVEPDETLHIAIDELLGRSQEKTPRAEPTLVSESTPPAAARPEPRSPEAAPNPAQKVESPAPTTTLSPITRAALLMMLLTLALLALRPLLARKAASPTAVTASTTVTPAASDTPRVQSAPAHAAAQLSEPAAPRAQAEHSPSHGVSAERRAADLLAAGDYAAALESYRTLASRSPAHEAAVQILERRSRTKAP